MRLLRMTQSPGFSRAHWIVENRAKMPGKQSIMREKERRGGESWAFIPKILGFCSFF